jgi:hypothetical protein
MEYCLGAGDHNGPPIACDRTTNLSLYVKVPRLVFEEFPPAHFTSQAAEVSIYNVAVYNIGNREASDVKVYIALLPATINIQEIQVKPSALHVPTLATGFVWMPKACSIIGASGSVFEEIARL